MNRRWNPLLTVLLVGLPWSTPVLAQEPASVSAVAIAERADEALTALRTLRADFTQRVENPVLERVTTGAGTLVYDAAGRLRIAYTDPAGDIVVNDGEHVWIYLPSSQPGQVIRQLSGESGVQNPLTFLRDLRGMYTLHNAGSETVDGRPTDRLELEPKAATAPYAELVVWVDRASGLLLRVRTRTEQDVLTTYTFRGFSIDGRVSEAEFAFEVPRNVEVFDQ